jgi:hypothetical protein
MDWFYVLNQQQQGPVADAQLDDLARSGVINRDTLVWREGWANWQPMGTARPVGSGAAVAAPPMLASGSVATCVECQGVFAQNDMVRLNQMWVCARCKPIFLQRLAEGVSPATALGMVWRVNRQLVMRPETPLPDRCVKCNAPANGYQLKRQLYWHHPALYLLIIVSLLVYVIVAICVRKKAVIHIGLCEHHRKQRGYVIAGSWLAVVAGVIMLIAGISNSSGGLAVAGIALLLGGAIFGAVRGPMVAAAKIDKDYVWVRGPGQAFLADLPEWTGPR